MRRIVGVVVCMAGCTFGVDPIQVAIDAAEPDIPMSVDDLSRTGDLQAAPDLTQAEPDMSILPDMKVLPDLQPDLVCTTAVFAGFGAGGAVSPVDCRGCGCILDDFTSLSTARWTSTQPAEWTTTMVAGVLTFSTAGSSNGARTILSSDGKFYLEGDFDLRVDYSIGTWASGGGANLSALGPGSTLPTVYAHTYQVGASRHFYLIVDDQTLDTIANTAQGTFQITRAGTTLCAGVLGGPSRCRTNSETKRVTVGLQNTVDNAACSTSCAGAGCCAQHTEFRNLRLVSGVIADAP